MLERVNVIGAGGRAGSALAARLRQRGITLRERDPELVLLCVPDAVIAEVATGIPSAPGPLTSAARHRFPPWIHTSAVSRSILCKPS